MASFGDWFRGLRGRLLMMIAIPMTAMAIVGAVAINGIIEQSKDMHEMTKVRLPVTSLTGELRTNIHAIGRYLWTAINSDSEKQVKESLDQVRRRIKQFGEDLHQYQTLPLSEKGKAIFAPVAENWHGLDQVAESIATTVESNTSDAKDKARKLMLASFAQPATAITEALNAADSISDEVNESVSADAEKTAKSSMVEASVAIGIGAFVALLVGLITASRLAKGLGTVASQIAEGGVQVSSASEQLSSASQQLSAGATESASSLEETVASVEQLSSMVKLNAENAKEASALSQTSRQSAEEGEMEIRKLNDAMGEIAQSSKKIEEIINVIDDIAFQTNLLALNAAVEAARAGEQGKGFAVVAEAVRTLAQRSSAAAKDITTLIKDSVGKIDRGAKIADEGARVLRNIVTSVKRVADLNSEIASASHEQSNGLSQISKAMNELDQATQRNASSAEETAAASEEMSSQAVVLQSTVVVLTSIVDGRSRNSEELHVRPSAAPRRPTQNRNLVMVRNEPSASGSDGNRGRAAENIIPFNQDEAVGKVGTTAGF